MSNTLLTPEQLKALGPAGELITEYWVRPRVDFRRLTPVAYFEGWTWRRYAATSLAEIEPARFWDDLAGIVFDGDLITVVAPDGRCDLVVAAEDPRLGEVDAVPVEDVVALVKRRMPGCWEYFAREMHEAEDV